MNPVDLVESLFGQNYERLFKKKAARFEPLEADREIRKAICARERRLIGKVYVPNRIVVSLSHADALEFAPLLEEIRVQFMRSAEEVVKSRGYLVVAPFEVLVREDAKLPEGSYRVECGYTQPAVAQAHTAKPQPRAEPAGAKTTPPPPSVVRASLPSEPEPPARVLGTIEMVDKGTAMRVTERTSLLIGRDDDCDIVLDHSTISGRHARLIGSPKGAILRDLDSTNGLKLRGEKRPEVLLADGDRVRLGKVELVFHAEPTPLATEGRPPDPPLSKE